MSLLARRNIELSAEVVVESNNGPMTTWMVTMADASGLLPRRSISGRSKGFLVDGSSPGNPRAAGSSNEATVSRGPRVFLSASRSTDCSRLFSVFSVSNRFESE